MSRVQNSLEILKLLRKFKKITANEIAKELNITSRIVKIYVTDLRNCGFDIESILGKYGGYKLNEVNLNEEEWQLLFRIEDSLHGEEKVMFKKILDKIDYRLNKTF